MGTLADALRRHGLIGVVRRSVDRLLTAPKQRAAARASRSFDHDHGVDTSGIVRLGSLAIESPNAEYGVRYQATTKEAFDLLVGDLPIRHQDYTFVDFGAGKGRALLLAAEMPFRRVIGVEFSAELAAVARLNIDRYRGPRRCARVEVVVGDAVDFEPPNEPLVAYFFNPFAEPVMQRVADNLARSFDAAPRPVYALLTGDAPLGPVLEAAGFARVARGFPGEGSTRGVFALGLAQS